jgi:hypothetical protein
MQICTVYDTGTVQCTLGPQIQIITELVFWIRGCLGQMDYMRNWNPGHLKQPGLALLSTTKKDRLPGTVRYCTYVSNK